MAKPLIKLQAQKMRRNGYGIKEISRKLNVSPSSVSFWCRDMALTEKMQTALVQRSRKLGTKGLLAYAEQTRAKRHERTQLCRTKGGALVHPLSKRDITMLGIGLYWGEGYKRGSEEFGFTNSDPQMLKFYILWLRTVFDVSRSDLILRVSVNTFHQSRERVILQFWSKNLKVSLAQFTKTSFVRVAANIAPIHRATYYGTLRIKVRRGTDFRRTVLGAIEKVGKQC